MAPGTEKEETTSVPRVWAPPEPHLFLVVEGARPLAGGLRISLDGVDEIAFCRGDERRIDGAGATRKLSLQIPDRRVSSSHARLCRRGESWLFEDLGSTNGSRLNGSRVERAALVDGDILQVGRALLRLRTHLPTPPGTPRVVEEEGTLSATATLIPALAAELAIAMRAARSSVPFAVLGETGTGKELAARAVHALSLRKGPFVAINCAALPPHLVESQLFGHTRGAFSGAVREEVGLVRSAHGGTLFLDEVGDLPLAAQAVMLRLLQEKEVVPVGATKAISVDVRIVIATHQPLDAMIEAGAFRKDLWGRLQGFLHRLWPMRERREDIGVLLASILRDTLGADAAAVELSDAATFALASYPFPLNIRELAQAVARARAVAENDTIDAPHLPHAMTVPAAPTPPRVTEGVNALIPEGDALLRETLEAELRRQRGNVSAVARTMNKAPMQVYRWLRRLGIDPDGFR